MVSARELNYIWPYFRIEPVLQQYKTPIPSTTLQYELNYLEPATEYIFMVAAVNEAGESDISNVLSAKTFDAGKSQILRKLM